MWSRAALSSRSIYRLLAQENIPLLRQDVQRFTTVIPQIRRSDPSLTVFHSRVIPLRLYAAAASNEKPSPSDSSDSKSAESAGAPNASKTEIPAEKSGLSDKEKGLAEEVAKLQEERKETHEKYLRALAEIENTRQRLTRQINDAKQFGIQSFVKDLLEVSDILTKAMGSVPQDALSSSDNVHLKNLFEGLRLTEAQMMKVFKKHGLEQIEAMGSKFDPNIHEALFEAPAQSGQTPGTVMAVTQTGFKLHNRTVRPARVGVVKSA